MSSIEHRRRAWAALKLGPLWHPIAGALPNGPTAPSPAAWPAGFDEGIEPPGHDEPACADPTAAPMAVEASGTVAADGAAEQPAPSPDSPPSTASTPGPRAPLTPPPEDAPPEAHWGPGGEQPLPEEAWTLMAAEAAYYAASPEPMADAWAPEDELPASSVPPGLGRSPSTSGPAPVSGAMPDVTAPSPVAPPAPVFSAEDHRPARERSSPADEHPPERERSPLPEGHRPAQEPSSPADGHRPAQTRALAEPGAEAEAEAEAGTMTSIRPDRSLPDEVRWQRLRETVASCHRCGLADTRRNTVFGRGRQGPTRWMLIGEAPGAEEDRRGEAFVGQAGQLLDAMLAAVGIDPAHEVFIANVLKCRPPGNRNPELYEVNQCEGYLHEQIRLADPGCILLLGRFAAQSVLNSSLSINRLRNRIHHIRLAGRDVPVVCTFHPAYLLRNPLDKLKSWEDLCLARSVLEKPGHDRLPLPPRRPPAG